MRNHHSIKLLAALTILVLSGCQLLDRSKETLPKLEPYECGEMTRLHVFDEVFLGSMPSQGDIDQAKKGGIKSIISLRHAKEHPDFDEAAAAKASGMAYYNPAFNGAEELTDAKLDELLNVLRKAEKPTLLHCGSANRVGAVWMAYRVLDAGLEVDAAAEEAKVVGLKTPAYETRVRDYLKKK